MKNHEVKIATNIETGVFYSIVEWLGKFGWTLTAEYDEIIFDKGIDFDYYEFSNGSGKIRLAWNNWFEGEMQGTIETLNEIAHHFKVDLKFNEPEYLHRPDFFDGMKNLIRYKT